MTTCVSGKRKAIPIRTDNSTIRSSTKSRIVPIGVVFSRRAIVPSTTSSAPDNHNNKIAIPVISLYTKKPVEAPMMPEMMVTWLAESPIFFNKVAICSKRGWTTLLARVSNILPLLPHKISCHVFKERLCRLNNKTLTCLAFDFIKTNTVLRQLFRNRNTFL